MARFCMVCLLGMLSCPLLADTLVDPTMPLAGMPDSDNPTLSQQPLPQLQGIVISNAGRSAVLNGLNVQIGQQVAGYRVLAIHSDAVILERDGRRQTLSLYSDKVRIQ